MSFNFKIGEDVEWSTDETKSGGKINKFTGTIVAVGGRLNAIIKVQIHQTGEQNFIHANHLKYSRKKRIELLIESDFK